MRLEEGTSSLIIGQQLERRFHRNLYFISFFVCLIWLDCVLISSVEV